MSSALSKVVGLLESEELELRWAAAKVLGALKPNGANVLPALIKALSAEDVRLRRAALAAIGSIGGSDAYDAVAALLEEPGDVGRQAMEVLAGMDTDVARRLKRHFNAATDTGRRRILTIAARLRGAHGMDLIVRALEVGYAEEVRAIGRRLGTELADAGARERKTLLSRLEKFLDSVIVEGEPGSGRGRPRPRRTSGGSGCPAAHARICHQVQSGRAPQALASGPQGDPRGARKLEEDVSTRLLGFLDESDFTNIVAPAMEVLEAANLGAAHVTALLKFVRGHDPALRRFAVSALGQVNTPKSATALLEILQGDNPDLQKRAADSLSKQTMARPLIAAALAKAADVPTAWVLARILHPYADRLTTAQVGVLGRVRGRLDGARRSARRGGRQPAA